MEKQLNLFQEDAGHYFISIDSKVRDFVIYNRDAFVWTEEEIFPDDLVEMFYKELTPTIQKLKSEAWSCGCRWFFILQQEGIYLFNVFSNRFFLCKKHTYKFIDMYLTIDEKKG